jgi:tetratricopeptide (TPR) repeat protein
MRSRTAILPFLLLLVAGSARAGDARPVDLPLVGGKTITGVVESSDATEVVVRTSPEEVRRIPWATLAPLGVWRAKAALAPPADGPARLALAELAADLGLWVETRAEYEKALALGAVDGKRFAESVADAEKRAVEQGVGRARLLAETGDIAAAIETARRLKLDFASAPNAGAVEKLIDDLVKQRRDLDADAEAARVEIEKALAQSGRNKEILERLTRAALKVQEGDAAAQEAAEVRKVGNVTRSGRFAEKGDAAYFEARRDLGRLRRILPPEHPEREEVLARLSLLDRRHFDLLFQTARFFWDQRVYSRAEEYANRAAWLDPVHPDLLDLRDRLRESRIRYKFSDVTNARPIVR